MLINKQKKAINMLTRNFNENIFFGKLDFIAHINMIYRNNPLVFRLLEMAIQIPMQQFCNGFDCKIAHYAFCQKCCDIYKHLFFKLKA